MTSAGNVGTVHSRFLNLITNKKYLVDDVDFVIVCVRGDGLGRRRDKEVDDVSGLLTGQRAPIFQYVFYDHLERNIDLVEDKEFGSR